MAQRQPRPPRSAVRGTALNSTFAGRGDTGDLCGASENPSNGKQRRQLTAASAESCAGAMEAMRGMEG